MFVWITTPMDLGFIGSVHLSCRKSLPYAVSIDRFKEGLYLHTANTSLYPKLFFLPSGLWYTPDRYLKLELTH